MEKKAYNIGWFDGPERFCYVNRNVISQCQRDYFFDVVSKLAPGNIGVDIGGPGFDRNGIRVMGLNIAETANDVVADALELPFLDESVDFFLSSHALEHVKDVSKAIKEMSRCLKIDGLVAVTIPDVRYFEHGTECEHERDLAPSEMTAEQFKEIVENSTPELEILLWNTHDNNFDFNLLACKKEVING